MVQNETMKPLSLSCVDFRTGLKPKAQPGPDLQMDYGPKVEAPVLSWGQWAENNTDMPIIGICIKKADFQLSVETDTHYEKLASFRHQN